MNKKIRMRSKDGNISLITEPLIFAIRTGNKEFVRTLLKNNINLNEQDKFNNNPLMIASETGNAILKELINNYYKERFILTMYNNNK